MTATTTATPRPDIETLLEIELGYEPGLTKMSSDDGRPGTYLGSGAGRVSGDDISGTARWDLRENQGSTACEMFFSGVIETADGATIAFETLGHGRVTDPDTAPSLWDVTASVRFTSNDERYDWLTSRPATWYGEFDMDTYEHRYRVVRK